MEKGPEKLVYLVRHGQSEGNISPYFQPLDSPLSEEGKKQAGLIAERLNKIPFEILISSPLVRAKETSEMISKLSGKNVIHSDLFAERFKPTAITGKPHNDPEALRIYNEWTESLYESGKRISDGENFDDLIKRADKALNYLESRSEKTLAVVSHGFFLGTLIARVLLGESLTGSAFREFQLKTEMENTGISVLKNGLFYGRNVWGLRVFNDHAHLG